MDTRTKRTIEKSFIRPGQSGMTVKWATIHPLNSLSKLTNKITRTSHSEVSSQEEFGSRKRSFDLPRLVISLGMSIQVLEEHVGDGKATRQRE